jgi:predicted RNA-binding Zn ribbon-like protein
VHYEIVDGYPMPALFAGDPALELCNTWAGWELPPEADAPVDPRRDYLADFDRFAVWTAHVGLLDRDDSERLRALGRERPRLAGRSLRDVWRLRTAVHDAALDRAATDAFDAVATYADRAASASRLTRDGNGLAARHVDQAIGVSLGLLVAAQAAERLLADPASGTVRACPGDDCGWLFLDPRGRRRWCSMTSCGNRAKVRAHAARQS